MLSIVLPAFNAEKTIYELLKSILAQSFQDWELIVIDDGSTDKTFEILKEFSKIESRITVITQENKGYRSVRNTGLEVAKGEYVTFIDSDDRLLPNFFESALMELELFRVEMLITGYNIINEDGKKIKEIKYSSLLSENVFDEVGSRLIGSAPSLSDSIMPVVWSNFYSTSIIKENFVRFQESTEIVSEDLYFNLEYLKYIERIKVSEIIGYEYRIHNNSITQLEDREKIFLQLAMINLLTKQISPFFTNQVELKKRLELNFLISLRSELFTRYASENFIGILKRHKKILNNLDVRKILTWTPIKEFSVKRKIFVIIVKMRLYLITSLITLFRTIFL